MDKQDLIEQLNKSQEEIDGIIDEIKQGLMSEDRLVTPTNFRDKTGLHHNRYTMVINYLVNNDEDVVVVPSSNKGRLLAHRDQLEVVVEDALKIKN